MRRRRFPHGLTLVEVLVTVMVLGIVASLATIGTRFLSDLMRVSSSIDHRRQAQMVLYEMEREVRNANTVLTVSSDTLRFEVFDFSKGYDTNTNAKLTTDVNVGTMTYRYQENGGRTYLEEKFEKNNVLVHRHELLPNMLRKPDMATLYISTSDATPPNVEMVKIFLRLKSDSWRNPEMTYSAEAMIRTRQQ